MAALMNPIVGHLDTQFVAVMDEIQDLLRQTFKAPNARTLTISGTGTAGMETALANFVEPGDNVLICSAGYFGDRLTAIADRYGAEVQTITVPWGSVFIPEMVDEALQDHPTKLVAIVQGETSTGAWQSIKEIGQVVRKHKSLLLVDAVASWPGVPFEMEAWGVDIVYSGSQKCLSAPPGIALMAIGSRAWEMLQRRETAVGSWYFDLNLLFKYWEGETRAYHHTAPISMNYAVLESLRMVVEEGLDTVHQRHAETAAMLWAGLESRGYVPDVPLSHRLPSLTTVRIPEGVDDMGVRRSLMTDYDIEIAGGLGAGKGKVWRIGLMGHSARPANVMTLLGALDSIKS
jgi:alanine-glyoxylate transaminase/serine-glyoxylate transaminase/serine-pyruvate transaminase